ncbi:hypothetical protein BDV97DRAFT_373196 [Delphinella strobiligena]|nr:hypothetical protein BDV97DRAFT_373196 [Delphinella strobiligena]
MTTTKGESDDIPFIARQPVSEELNDLGDLINTHLSAAWRFNVKAGTVVASGVLIANISMSAWANARFGLKDGSSTVFEGSCSLMKRITLWANLTINILSTLLLGASNNCAQLLTSPTRKDVDLAHIKGKWLDTGVPSTRNISIIGRWRFFLLSVLYNSVFYSTTSANDYMAAIVTEDFVKGGYWNKTRATNLLEALGYSRDEELSTIVSLQNRTSDLERLGNAECIQAYGTSTLVSNWLKHNTTAC